MSAAAVVVVAERAFLLLLTDFAFLVEAELLCRGGSLDGTNSS